MKAAAGTLVGFFVQIFLEWDYSKSDSRERFATKLLYATATKGYCSSKATPDDFGRCGLISISEQLCGNPVLYDRSHYGSRN